MRVVLLFVLFLSFHAMANFSGHWESEGRSYSLTLDLIESGRDLTGRYCFITNNGSRIDCAGDGDVNMHGLIKNNIAIVSFESTFGGVGKATLSISNGIITYTIDDYTPFVDANMSVPKVINLKRAR